MRTESDLRAAIDHVATQAPTGADVLSRLDLDSARARLDNRTPRRSYLLPAATAAAVVLVAGAVAVYGPFSGHDRHPAQVTVQAGVGPSLAHPCATGGSLADFIQISMHHVDGIAASPNEQTNCSGVSETTLQTPTGMPAGVVEVFKPDIFDTRSLNRAIKVSGSGRTGYLLPRGSTALLDVANVGSSAHTQFVCSIPPTGSAAGNSTGRALTATPSPGTTTYHGPAGCTDNSRILAWQYAPKSWALVSTPAQSTFRNVTARLMTMAAAVDIARTNPSLMPFTADTLPANIRIVGTYAFRTAHGRLLSIGVALGVAGRTGCPADTACSTIGEILVQPTPARSGKPAGTPVDINGHPGYLLDQGEQRPDIQLAFTVEPWRVSVGQGSNREAPDSDLLIIGRSLHFASSITNQATWFRISAAFRN